MRERTGLDPGSGPHADGREPTAGEPNGASPMPAESARANRRLLEGLLRDDGTGFQFFQAVRLLERLYPDKGRVGDFTNPSDEVARFRVPPSLAFPPAEIQSTELPRDDSGQAWVTANFMGLVGPVGVMPFEYTLLVAREAAAGNAALADFLNIFEHRFISLFYRAWKKYRVWVGYEEGDGHTDPFTEHMLDCVGQGLPAFRGHLPFDERVLLYYASLLVAPHRGAVALEQLINDYFGVPASVEQFVGEWYGLRGQDLCEISEEPDGFNVLGAGAVVGDEIHDLHTRVRIRLGPLKREDFENFLPGRPGHRELAALTRLYGQDRYDFEVQLVLEREGVPRLELGGDEECELGWLTWVRSTPFERDADETVLAL